MASLAELIKARHQVTFQRELLAARRAALVDNQLRLEYATHRDALLAPSFADPFRAPERALRRRLKETLPGERDALADEIRRLEDEIRTTSERVEQLEAEQPPLWDPSAHPLVLFPVRLETVFRSSTRGVELLIRVYPDEIQVDALRRKLSRNEQQAGQTYWRSIWTALGDAPTLLTRVDEAWKKLGLTVQPERSAWVVAGTRPVNAPSDLASPASAPDAEPRFDTPADNPAETAGAHVVLLPDRWVAYGLVDDQLLFRQEGLPIRRPLPLTALRQTGRRAAAAGDGEWLVDFDKALAVGMALTVPLEGARRSIDQLFVVGTSATLTPDEAAGQIGDALTTHANRNALEFLPPRAPTNNSADSASSWHSARQQTVAPDALRLAFKPETMQNAATLARALGIDGREALAGIPNAAEDWQTSAGIVMDALWPAMTVDWDQLRRNELSLSEFGSSTQQASGYDETTMDALRKDAVDFVRNRGPLPAVRIGRQPYGILPVSSLDLWVNADEGPVEAMKLDVLRHLRPFWQAGLAKVPRVHGRQDQDRALLEVLVQDAVSAQIAFRKAVGHDNFDAAEPLTITPDLPWQSSLLTRNLHAETGLFDRPLVGDGEKLLRYWAERRRIIVEDCLVTPPADAQTIQNKATAFLAAEMGEGPPITNTLLYALFNYGQGREQDSIIGMDGITGDPNEFFARCARRQAALLDRLATVRPSELELLLIETLDLFSHRLDAWITSLATRRLSDMRKLAPSGCRMGSYGWVESLTAPESIPDFDEVRERDTDTYVLAPSLHHAASAAVLRSGFDAHTDEGAFGVNLTSGRARRARWIVDGVRSGQTIGALLGYWFERGLHDLQQDHRIAPLRERFPLPIVAGQQEEAPGQPFEYIAARNVADGLALYRALAGTNDVPLTDPARALVAELKGDAVVGPLCKGLLDLVDAVGDLLLAESVHHLVGGNPLRAGLAADTLGRGESLPGRFDIIASPRSGVGLMCSVAVVLPADATPGPGWNADRPRAILSPQADAWVSGMLGPAASWRFDCDIELDGATTTASVKLSELNLSALDVVYDLQVRAAGTASVLERRVLAHVSTTADPKASVQLATGARGAMWRTLASHVQRITGMLRGARPLAVPDLAPVDRVPNPALTATNFTTRLAPAGSSPSSTLTALSKAARTLAAASAAKRDAASDEVALASAIEVTHRANEYLRGMVRIGRHARHRAPALLRGGDGHGQAPSRAHGGNRSPRAGGLRSGGKLPRRQRDIPAHGGACGRTGQARARDR